MSPARRLLALGLATASATAVVGAPSPASADTFYSRSSGRTVQVAWLEVGPLPAASGVPGNAHFGDLWVEERKGQPAIAFGSVYDVECKPGVTPYNPGIVHHDVMAAGEGHPVPSPKQGCTTKGVRFLQAADLSLELGQRLDRAVLKGSLAVGDPHDPHGTPTAGPAVDVVLQGVGSLATSKYSYSYYSDTDRFSFRYRAKEREGAVAAGSRIGPMVFDDEPGEWSYARLGTFSDASRSRTR